MKGQRQQRRTLRAMSIAGILCLFTLMGNPALAEVTQWESWKGKCPEHHPEFLVYGVGSSTMGTSLGSALKEALKKKNTAFRKWGKASSGLARPDFHDWPKAIAQVVREKKPDVFVISLGTNDFQALSKGSDWIQMKDQQAWKAEYQSRVESVLEAAAGRDRKRMVIWITPTIFDGSKAIKAGKWIREIILENARTFGGSVFVVDAYAATTHEGLPKQFFKHQDGRKLEIYGGDKIHLTQNAVNALMVDPVIEILTPCLPKVPTESK